MMAGSITVHGFRRGMASACKKHGQMTTKCQVSWELGSCNCKQTCQLPLRANHPLHWIPKVDPWLTVATLQGPGSAIWAIKQMKIYTAGRGYEAVGHSQDTISWELFLGHSLLIQRCWRSTLRIRKDSSKDRHTYNIRDITYRSVFCLSLSVLVLRFHIFNM